MKHSVSNLLDSIRDGDPQTQEEAGLRLWMLLEKNFMRNRNDPVHREILPDDLFTLALNEADLLEIISSLETILFSDRVSLRQRASLVNLLGKIGRPESLRAILRFLRDYGADLDDESLNAVAIALSPAFLPKAERSRLSCLFREFDTESILSRILARNIETLNEPVRHALAGIEGLAEER